MHHSYSQPGFLPHIPLGMQLGVLGSTKISPFQVQCLISFKRIYLRYTWLLGWVPSQCPAPTSRPPLSRLLLSPSEAYALQQPSPSKFLQSRVASPFSEILPLKQEWYSASPKLFTQTHGGPQQNQSLSTNMTHSF